MSNQKTTLVACDRLGKVFVQRYATITVRTDDGAEVRVAVAAGDDAAAVAAAVAAALESMVRP